jgi:hypothetical protein
MLQLSLRSLLALMAMIAVAIVSLRYPTQGWEIASFTIAIVAFLAAIMGAARARGPSRAFALGMSITMLIYGLTLFSRTPTGSPIRRNPEMNPSTGRLLTSRLLKPLYSLAADMRWVDVTTGVETQEFDPSIAGKVTLSEWPERATFMAIGHCWWAMLLGLLGGWFARFVYLRREYDDKLLASGRG